ncbi:uncharacterized protein LOC119866764 isoform X3 [Canis lupus familiaris]|uniref:uncharacterized protein LOC119866764 isoform X3 n=1 Tax=Canis lupus familiaris TaxID=9615 RepID=UPI0018F31511|nr:uncharacterized protein LOC119866764 isoform X3 [Canis lupus familiaris]XP_038435771.1 uncharacterized protein LOC119866764 isoform X3 [Canis lupus familiaris]
MGGSSGRRAPWVTVAACFPCSAPRWTPLPGGAGIKTGHYKVTDTFSSGLTFGGDGGWEERFPATGMELIFVFCPDPSQPVDPRPGDPGKTPRVAPELQDGKTRRAFCLLLYPHYSEECLEKVIMFLIRASFREAYRYWITRTLKTASGCPYPMVCSWNPFTNRNCKCS